MNALRWWTQHDSLTTRFTLLLGLMLLLASVDYARHRQRATRGREYAFILVMGAVGSIVAMGIDLVTSSISPEYFLDGKGLRGQPSFRFEVLKVGAQAGFVMGFLVAGALLVANAPGNALPVLLRRRITRSCLIVLAAALAGACVLGVAAAAWPLELPFEIGIRIQPDRRPYFAAVWWTHVGAYGGALLGLAAQVSSIREARRLEAQRAI